MAGLFQPAQAYSPGGGGPGAVLTGDFNGDGSPDIVSINAGSNSVGLLLNRGDGTFAEASALPFTGNDPAYPAAGDFDGDGDLDFVVPGLFTGTLSVYLNQGHGTFDFPSTYRVGSTATSAVVGDFDEDGLPDLAVTDPDFYNTYATGHVAVLTGRGDGTFGDPVSYDAGPGALFLRSADLNSDGHLDLAVTHEQTRRQQFISVLFGRGDGGFSAPDSYPAGGNTGTIVAADLDGDGDIDLAASNYNEVGSVGIFDNRGDGTFGVIRTIAAGRLPFGIVAADFNGDGAVDLVTSDDGAATLSVFVNAGGGVFPTRDAYSVGGSPYGVATADFDGNGQPDLVSADRAGTLSVLLNTAPGRPVVTVRGGEASEAGDEASTLRFVASLSAPSANPVTIHYRTTDGTARSGLDFTATEGDITFAPGQTSLPLDVPILPDSLSEANEFFRVEISVGPDAYAGVASALGTILDDDPVAVSVGDVSFLEGALGTTPFVFPVRLARPSAQPLTVRYETRSGTAQGGVDFATTTGVLTFAPGEVSKTVTVPVLADAKPEEDETFSLDLSEPIGGVIGLGAGTGTIRDDDAAVLLVDMAEVLEGSSGATSLEFLVRLAEPSPRLVTVRYTTIPGTARAGIDYSTTTDVLVFAPGEVSKSVIVPVRGDTTPEDDETLTMELSLATGAVIAIGSAPGTILDDDPAVVSIEDATVTEGTSETSPLVFLVRLAQPSTRPVTVHYATAPGTARDGVDFTTTAGVLTFAPGEVGKSIVVPITGDTTPEGEETLFLVLSDPTGAVFASASATGTIHDDPTAPPVPEVGGPAAPLVTPGDAGHPDGPVVVDVARYGTNCQRTKLVITFSQPLAAAPAVLRGSYQLVDPGRDRLFGTRDDRTLRIVSAAYDAQARTVTLTPAQRLPLNGRFQLTVRGTNPGLAGTSGMILDGDADGRPGGDHVVIVTKALLRGPNNPVPPRKDSNSTATRHPHAGNPAHSEVRTSVHPKAPRQGQSSRKAKGLA